MDSCQRQLHRMPSAADSAPRPSLPRSSAAPSLVTGATVDNQQACSPCNRAVRDAKQRHHKIPAAVERTRCPALVASNVKAGSSSRRTESQKTQTATWVLSRASMSGGPARPPTHKLPVCDRTYSAWQGGMEQGDHVQEMLLHIWRLPFQALLVGQHARSSARHTLPHHHLGSHPQP